MGTIKRKGSALHEVAKQAIRQTEQSIPLCVDLDGTLLRTDLLHEQLLRVVKLYPQRLPELLGSLFRGKAAFKDHVARLTPVNGALLPFRDEVVTVIEAARARGQKIVLCTASPLPFAKAVADHLSLFDSVLSSSATTNLAAHNKADALTERFGEGMFDYIGDSSHDLAVFSKCRNGTLVSSQRGLRNRSLAINPNMEFIDAPRLLLKDFIRAIRWHQWIKNLLIFVPLVAAHAVGDMERLFSAVIAFVSFSLCASATYIANDLLDLDADRAHQNKKNRPFAAGRIPVSFGMAIAAAFLIASLLLSLMLSGRFSMALVGYIACTLTYSFALKRQVVLDVIFLAGLYTLRIIAGAAATQIMPSFWLLAFSMFIFLSLALVKRVSELRRTMGSRHIIGRGYVQSDMNVLLTLGSASGLSSVVILAFYMQSEIVTLMYPAKGWLWLIPPIMLYWITRLWMKTNRDEIDDDPVVFAARDWQSLAALALIGVLFLLAVIGPVAW